MKSERWVEKTFDFAQPIEGHVGLLDGLAGSPERLSKRLNSLERPILVERFDGKWSVQENVGHLLALEALFGGRLDDFEAGATELRPADMTNLATETARFNDVSISGILEDFALARSAYVERLRSYSPARFAASAWHARLGKQMRLIDQLEFQLAHDDHHIARIDTILVALQS